MAFHPDKCHQLPLTRARNPQTANTSYTLHNHTLELVPAAKYLGVTLQTDLLWGKHIDNTCSKANRMVCLLRRNLRKTKELAYKALVRPLLQYARSVWDPHSNQNINNIEKNRRRNNRLTMLYKITQGLACVSCDALKLLPSNNTRRRRGHSQQYQQLPCRTNYRLYSFLPRTIRDWNSVPEEWRNELYSLFVRALGTVIPPEFLKHLPVLSDLAPGTKSCSGWSGLSMRLNNLTAA
ncbi:hypothetical protein Bbelb_421300 [Branchiostoma belcheri]|nr:hypothetical protein Bbelb_421300 [Branchiostoma belcheri]